MTAADWISQLRLVDRWRKWNFSVYPAVVYVVGSEIFTGLPQELGAGQSLKLLCTLSNDQLHIKGLVGRQACKLSHDSLLVGEQSRGVSYKCARTCTKQNANIVFFSLPNTPANTSRMHSLTHTLPPDPNTRYCRHNYWRRLGTGSVFHSSNPW